MAYRICAGCGEPARYHIKYDVFNFWLCRYCLENKYPQNMERAIDMSEMFPKCESCTNPATLAIHIGTNELMPLACQNCYHRLRSGKIVESLDDLIPGRRKMAEFNKVQDSGVREEFSTGSRRDTQVGKGRPDLIPPYPMQRLAKHYENGAAKYGDDNWTKGQNLRRYIASAERHLQELKMGMIDEDHAIAVAWNMLSFVHTQYMIEHHVLPQELDDYTPSVQQHREAAEFEHLQEVGDKLRASGAYDSLGLISAERQEELDTVQGQYPKGVDRHEWVGWDNAEANQKELDKKTALEVLNNLRRVWGIALNLTYLDCMQSILNAEVRWLAGTKSWK